MIPLLAIQGGGALLVISGWLTFLASRFELGAVSTFVAAMGPLHFVSWIFSSFVVGIVLVVAASRAGADGAACSSSPGRTMLVRTADPRTLAATRPDEAPRDEASAALRVFERVMVGSMHRVPNGDTSFDLGLKGIDRAPPAIERRTADTKIRFALGKISVEDYHLEMDALDIQRRRALALDELRGQRAATRLTKR